MGLEVEPTPRCNGALGVWIMLEVALVGGAVAASTQPIFTILSLVTVAASICFLVGTLALAGMAGGAEATVGPEVAWTLPSGGAPGVWVMLEVALVVGAVAASTQPILAILSLVTVAASICFLVGGPALAGTAAGAETSVGPEVTRLWFINSLHCWVMLEVALVVGAVAASTQPMLTVLSHVAKFRS